MIINATDTAQAAHGLSVNKRIIGQTVYNDGSDKVGSISDLILSPSNSAAFAVLGVGGFLGMGQHDVLIPVTSLKLQTDDKKVVLPGATKDALKQLPEFKYPQ